VADFQRQPRKIDLDRLEARVLGLAGRQFGLVTRGQLLELGMPASQIASRVRGRRLVPAHAGVYWIVLARHDALARAMAAVLACGEGALLSHWSAASLWQAPIDWSFPVHVSCPRKRTRPGIETHRCRTLTGRDARTHRGIRATSPARTALDLAPELPDRRRARLVNDLLRRRLLRPDHLADVIARNPLHPGSKLLRPFVEVETGATASELEDLFADFLRRHGLPTPRFNATVDGREVDALFESQK
jgi:hypothetical protein